MSQPSPIGELSLAELVERCQSPDKSVSDEAKRELHDRTRGFVLAQIHSARAPGLKNQLATSDLEVQIAKSFLSYVGKPRENADFLLDNRLFGVLRTITRRIISRELGRLNGVPQPIGEDLFEGLADVAGSGSSEVEFRDFVESLQNRVRALGGQAMTVLEGALAGKTREEIRAEVGLDRGAFFHLRRKIHYEFVLLLADIEHAWASRAYLLEQDGKSFDEIVSAVFPGAKPEDLGKLIEQVAASNARLKQRLAAGN